MAVLLFRPSRLSILVDGVSSGKSELDVVHGGVERRIGVDVAFETQTRLASCHRATCFGTQADGNTATNHDHEEEIEATPC
jgi:hypothetical protein